MSLARPRTAIVLFNLGGPDRPESVRPFLYNLFSDPAIIRAPWPIRPILASLITRRRLQPALENYALIGGKSPLLELTQAQGQALEDALSDAMDVRCFVAMRYWHPFTEAAVDAVKEYAPDRVLLLPLYPQFSTTTTGSSLAAWREAAARRNLVAPTTALCCWHSDEAFTTATAAIVGEAYARARATLEPSIGLRVLFSAHGLPESIIKAGDPYQFQVERSVARVVEALAINGMDHSICYQSRVTPQVWIGPSTEDALEQAARDKVGVLVVPIAFVSEHSETLVELDIEYGHLAQKLGIPGYFRAPAQNSDAGFITALAGLARRALASDRALCSWAGARQCPKQHGDCPHARAAVWKDAQ